MTKDQLDRIEQLEQHQRVIRRKAQQMDREQEKEFALFVENRVNGAKQTRSQERRSWWKRFFKQRAA